MSRVITFSRFFPKYHPKAGEPTFFVEKVLQSLTEQTLIAPWEYNTEIEAITDKIFEPKHHTIRAGNWWSAGDIFSPRYWSGRPYASKQVSFAPDIEIKKVWNIEIMFETNQIHFGKPNGKDQWLLLSAGDIAKNDGLSVHDFYNWFDTTKNRKHKIVKAQIICWNENINY